MRAPSEVMVCAPSEEMRGVSMIRGRVWWRGRRCLDGISQYLCDLEVGVEDRGPKRK